MSINEIVEFSVKNLSGKEEEFISTLSLKIQNESIGNGSIVYKVSSGDTLYIYNITIAKRIKVLIVYITAGPTYIRTFETSSLIRFIKSPVRLRL